MLEVAPNLYRGPRPDDLAILQKLGIKRIINLESGLYDHWCPDTYTREEQHPIDFGMELIHIPMNDFTAPVKDDVAKAIAYMTYATPQVPTYIHCLAGKDRTGYVCAAYRMKVQHWPYDKAEA